jgi:Mn-containing catalase
LIKQSDDAGARETLTFLMQREVAHQKMFESALSAIQDNFPPGNIVLDEFAHEFFHTSSDETAAGNGTSSSPGYKLLTSQKLWEFSPMAGEPHGGNPDLPPANPNVASKPPQKASSKK